MTGVHLQHFFTFKVVKYWLFIFFFWTATLWTRWEAVSLIILYSQHFSLFFSHCFVLWKAGPRQTWKKLKVSVSRILGPVISAKRCVIPDMSKQWKSVEIIEYFQNYTIETFLLIIKHSTFVLPPHKNWGYMEFISTNYLMEIGLAWPNCRTCWNI